MGRKKTNFVIKEVAKQINVSHGDVGVMIRVSDDEMSISPVMSRHESFGFRTQNVTEEKVKLWKSIVAVMAKSLEILGEEVKNKPPF